MAISEEEVFQAADQIREAGKMPSALSIREITQTGSLGTIQNFLRKWRHQETLSAATQTPPPEAVIEAIKQFGDRLWQLSLQSSEKEAAIKVRKERDERLAAEQDTEQALKLIEELKEQQEKQEGHIQQLNNYQSKLQQQLQTQSDHLQQIHQEADRLKQEVEQLNSQVQSEKEANHQSQKALVELKTTESQLRTELQKSQTEQEQIGRDLAVLKNEHTHLNHRYQNLEKDLSTSHLKNDELEKQLIQTDQLRHEAEEDHKKSEHQLELSRQQCKSFENDKMHLEEQNNQLKKMIQHFEEMLENSKKSKEIT